MIEIEVKNLRKVDTLLINLGKRASIPSETTLKQIGQVMLASVDKNFESEGRPQKWAPLSAMTLAMRRNKNKGSIKILQDTGNLRRSINYQILDGGNGLAIGTSVPYAKIHQYGGDVKIPARTIVPVKAKVLRFVTKDGKVVYAKKVEQKARMVHIPQRKFLLFQEEDIADIRSILVEGMKEEMLN